MAHSDPEAALRLKSEPALRWTNPERETDGGLVFLWLGRGRPEAISCFYRVRFEGRLVEAHEFVSLAPVGLTATLRERTVWSPPVPGLEFRPVPGAPRPSTTPAERLRQLRALAREFHVAVDVDTGPTELRLLPQPIARFGGEDANSIAHAGAASRSPDGALFGFRVASPTSRPGFVIEERPGSAAPAFGTTAFAKRISNWSLTARRREPDGLNAPRDRRRYQLH